MMIVRKGFRLRSEKCDVGSLPRCRSGLASRHCGAGVGAASLLLKLQHPGVGSQGWEGRGWGEDCGGLLTLLSALF